MLAVSELFYSIQGEGHFAGHPAAFIRLQGCPVGCSFCDTKHTWKANRDHEVLPQVILEDEPRNKASWAYIYASDLVDWVKAHSHKNAIVVVTGGEPLMQVDTPLLVDLLRQAGCTVQIETSGTFDSRVFEMANDSYDNNPWITVSPKFEGKLEVKLELLEKADEIKVVLSSDTIRDWIRKSLTEEPSLKHKFYIQPETGPNFKSSATSAVALCKEFGCRLSLQTHTFLDIR